MPADTMIGRAPSKLFPRVRSAPLDDVELAPDAVAEPELPPLPEAPVDEAEDPVAVEAGVVPFGMTEKD